MAMNKLLRVMSVVGARPNFMKIAPIAAHFNRYPQIFQHFIVHTGQHYDKAMSESFFETLRIPKPNVDLGIGSGSHAEQVGRTMIEFEKVVHDWQPDWVVVVGDVNATAACAITAKKEHVQLAHVEAGLRSGDMEMPEEVNRLVTDRLSDLLFTTDELADANLRAEGVPASKIRRVGNVMIDTLDQHREKAAKIDLNRIIEKSVVNPHTTRNHASLDHGYVAVTLHRPSNVDDKEVLGDLVDLMVDDIAPELPVIWTIHPRTRKQLEIFGLSNKLIGCDNVFPVEPLGYREMLRLNLGARVMLTDSGGLQEECCVLGTPCITLRNNTERPITLKEHGGVCVLGGNNREKIRSLFNELKVLERNEQRPPLWDGRSAERIVNTFAEIAGAVE